MIDENTHHRWIAATAVLDKSDHKTITVVSHDEVIVKFLSTGIGDRVDEALKGLTPISKS